MEIPSLIIRQSPAVLVYRISWVTCLMYALTTALYPLIEQLWTIAGFGDELGNRLVWSFFTILIELCSILTLFVHWSLKVYEIRPFELMTRSGLLNLKSEIHSLRNMQTVQTRQTMFGRMFRYGSVTLINPLSKKEIVLESVSDPEYIAQLARQVIEMPAKEVIVKPSNKQ